MKVPAVASLMIVCNAVQCLLRRLRRCDGHQSLELVQSAVTVACSCHMWLCMLSPPRCYDIQVDIAGRHFISSTQSISYAATKGSHTCKSSVTLVNHMPTVCCAALCPSRA